ncbi:hypothetical protein M9458_051718 [Cirrhinus mrigala]|uniref:Alkylated DNA repair protein AlkB homologue 8 N-terminal domain-containing protein n=1 Tax=Cirrhinus mrigala TaxID=683832 RepID=A0ABD0MTR1_CIRMR
MYPAYTLPSQPLPGVASYSAQPTSNVQPHHLTSAPPLSQLVPPTAPLQSSYRRVEGPSFPDLTREDESQYLMVKMALSNLLDPGESEQYKYHILLDHLKVDQAKTLALAYVYAPDPYTQAIRALDEGYSQPRQLALIKLQAIMEMPAIRIGDGSPLSAQKGNNISTCPAEASTSSPIEKYKLVSLLESINNKLAILKLLHQDFKELKTSLKFSQSQIEMLQMQNNDLQTKILALTTQITNLTTENNQMKETILDLQCRSMRENLIFTGIPETPQENPEDAIKEFMYSSLKLPMPTVNTISFHRVHRIGQKNTEIKQPCPVVAKFKCYKQRISENHNNLELNTLKTVEMTVDFRRNPPALPPLTIMDSTVTSVETFRLLGTTLTQNLKWDNHIDLIVKKAQQRLYFLRQLRKFNLPKELLKQFYSAITESVLCTSITVWFSSATKSDLRRLQRIVRSAE